MEIGNTALKAAWIEGTILGRTFRYQGERPVDFILSIISKEKPSVLTVASANPISASDESRLEKECVSLLILDANHTLLSASFDFPNYLTYDRAASLFAVRHMFSDNKRGCTIIDFGTTLTIDFLSPDGKYEGGNISPGCRTRFKALNRYSKVLPLVDTPQTTGAYGNSVRESIESGVISGIMFEIEGYINSHPGNFTVFTGGDAIYFVKRLKKPIFVVCNLVLMGLALITDEYVIEGTSV